MPKNYSELKLYKIFGQHARHISVGNFYYIYFLGKDLSGHSPMELFEKVKSEYELYKKTNSQQPKPLD